MMISLIIGVVGTSFLAGAVFSFLAKLIPLFILLTVIGLIGCALPYFIYNKIREKKTLEVNPLIDRQFDIIYETCEKASKMLV
jgi:5-bromo-4-chloroindolyl phosphate hydrolysis protein